MRKIGFLVLLLVFSFLLVGREGSIADKGRAFDPKLAQQLQKALEKAVISAHIPGAVLGVRSPDGAVFTTACGYADLKEMRKMSTDLHLRIGSVTKTLTATLILQLIDQGKDNLTLDTTVAEVLPDVNVANGEHITIRNLLAMRSGFGNYSFNPDFIAAFEKDYSQIWTPEQLIAYSNRKVDQPGTKVDYNNANYILLGMIIEQVTHLSYEEAIQFYILDPLYMYNTRAPKDANMMEPFAYGYLNKPSGVENWTFRTDPSWGWAAGSMISTVDDMLVWIAALVDGKLISKELQAERMKMNALDGNKRYGLGVMNWNGAVGHNGNYSGIYTSWVTRYHGYDFVIICNGQNSGGDDASSKADTLFWYIIDQTGV